MGCGTSTSSAGHQTPSLSPVGVDAGGETVKQENEDDGVVSIAAATVPAPAAVDEPSGTLSLDGHTYLLWETAGRGADGEVIRATLRGDVTGKSFAVKIIGKGKTRFRRRREGKYGHAVGQLAREIAIMKKVCP